MAILSEDFDRHIHYVTYVDYADFAGETTDAEPKAEAKPALTRTRRAERPDEQRKDQRREERKAPASGPRQSKTPEDGPDEGWNGPVPEFLAVGFDH